MFCDGDFWHGRRWASRRARLAKGANPDYWIAKIKANMARDRRHTMALERDGWTVIRLWEGDIKANTAEVAALVHGVVTSRLSEMTKRTARGGQ